VGEVEVEVELEVEVDREAVHAYTHGESASSSAVDSHSCGKEELQEVQFDRQPQMPTRISRWTAQAQQDGSDKWQE